MIHASKHHGRVKLNEVMFAGVLLFFLAALLIVPAREATAANIVVNSLANTRANNGLCTLREAVINANANNQSGSTDCTAGSGADTITFSVAGKIVLNTTLVITSDVTVVGANVITLSGNNSVQVFLLTSSASLTLQDVTVANGFSSTGAGGADNLGGTLNVINSTFSGNRSAVGGGGIVNLGKLTINRSTFSANTGNLAGGAIGNVGRIVNGGGAVNISDSTFSHNTALFGGGLATLYGSVAITNSTFAGNDSTFSGSSASVRGGILNDRGTVTIANSIVANGQGSSCSGTIKDGGNNIDTDATCGFSLANNSQPATNPLLDPAGLQNNGGPTKTIALCTGLNAPSAGCTGPSPAIDAGNNTICAAAPVNNTDQRGFVRPVDGSDADSTPTCDIGAFESGAQPPLINDLVTFATLTATFNTTSDTGGCPAGFVGKFSFTARLTDNPTSPAVSDLRTQVKVLTNGNLLLNADGGPAGVGAVLTVPPAGQYADGVLSPGEFVDVPFVICLQQSGGFGFTVDVVGFTQ